MRHTHFLLAIFFFIKGCSKEEIDLQVDKQPLVEIEQITNHVVIIEQQTEEHQVQQEDSILGTWQLFERFDGGSPNPNQSIENGEIITFWSDSLYSNSTYLCDGKYKIDNSYIEISVKCLTSDLLVYYYSIEKGTLILSDSPSTCDEGCYDKYKRIFAN